MPYDIKHNEQQNLLSITYHEPTTFEERTQVLGELVEYLRQTPHIRILIDASEVKQHLSQDDQIRFGEMLGRHSSYFMLAKVAIINPRRVNPFIIDISYSEGHENQCEFEYRKDALEWLCPGKDEVSL